MYSEFAARSLRTLILLGGMLFAQSASATFHLWVLSELYSNAGGTVQYIELSTAAGGQEFLSGHAISASQGSVIHTFNFPTDLPGDTAGHKFLIGTQGFANLGIVTPDYIVPNGFLFLSNGSVNFAGVDSVNYSALPTDGVNALNRNGNSVTNAPTNFAGKTGVIPAASSSISDAQVFAYAEANYPSIFTGAATAGRYQQYNYRYYPASGNYLAVVDATGMIYILGPVSGGVITSVGAVSSFAGVITAWEATQPH